jgi:glycine/D-amino acid oxidase-like deaminating enzyme
MPIDVLIVGQGLAGSLLAWECINQGYNVLVVDSGEINASQVAAGLINPVTGQRLVKQPGIDYLLPTALTCYAQLSAKFNQLLFKPLPMLRILKTPLEQQSAQKRLNQRDYHGFLSIGKDVSTSLVAHHGILQQTQTGYLNTSALLGLMRKFLIENASYQQSVLNYAEITLQPRLSWQSICPKHIVFCEGHHGMQNPWFGHLPFQPSKGEILHCQTPDLLQQHILNFGQWLIPTGDNQFKLGASFESGKTDTITTQRAKQTLLQALSAVVPGLKSIEVLNQQAGVRPATLDKQAFIGSHPQFGNLHIFNGFGAKGSLLIPWYARQFVKYLFQQTPLPTQVNIQRYYETHYIS